MDWRSWLYHKLSGSAGITILVPEENILPAGRLSEPPSVKPFIVLRLDPATYEFADVMSQGATIWVHDEPGSYLRIDAIIEAIHAALNGQVAEPKAIAAVWQGDSLDMSDDSYKTILRTTSYRLVGRR
jgi:hypothetical protein